jgi:GDPmannose 4,6-dehydratase
LLAELLLEQQYEVFGVVRRAPSEHYGNLDGIRERIELIQADLLDQPSLVDALKGCEPHEVYNLASVSFVPMSWKQPVLTAEFAAVGVTTMLESIRAVDEGIRFYQASSSEIFGEPVEVPQTEQTALAPLTPYGVAKAYGHFITRSYRRRYGLHASSGILYNHESPRRPLDFVTRKIAHAAAGIKLGLQGELWLGNLDARRDWGYAGDYVRAMWLMLQQDEPGDYVIATGETHSVRELVAVAFERVGLDPNDYVQIDSSLERGKAELHDLVGDPTKAREQLGWTPTVSFEELVHQLVDADLEVLGAGMPAEHDPESLARQLRVDVVVTAGTLVPGEASRSSQPSFDEIVRVVQDVEGGGGDVLGLVRVEVARGFAADLR